MPPRVYPMSTPDGWCPLPVGETMARMRALLLLFKCRFGVRPAGFRRRDEGVKDGEPDPWPSRSGSAGTRRWFLRLVVVGMGILVGVGVFTFGYADGAAYLSSDPAVCTNCHVMRENYDGWVKSSHGKVAVCNDCHAPHDAIGKWTTKAVNGWNHSLAFTTGRLANSGGRRPFPGQGSVLSDAGRIGLSGSVDGRLAGVGMWTSARRTRCKGHLGSG